MFGWNENRARRLKALEETAESQRREIDALRYDLGDVKARLQKLLWRVGKEKAAEEATTFPVDEPPKVDAVSAEIMRRRQRAVPRNGNGSE